MRILKLRFRNLNSLYGTWTIDFTNPEYVTNGIFAITGPTGAGKSTVLDSICLALYGRTPRLKSITKSSNEIMSRQTGECFAEVTFETSMGKYVCHWSQRRAKKNPNGKLQDSKHEISDANSKKIIESKKRNVANAIEQKTGMDFDRFTRSMLLAQGGFAAFLQAQVDERAPILEQITGTEIYSDISKKVHERQREESTHLDILNAKSTGMHLLTVEEEVELALQLEEIISKETLFAESNKNTNALILWKQDLEFLSHEIESIEKESKELLVSNEEFQENKNRLQIAQNAAEIGSEYSALREIRKQQIDDRTNQEELSDQLPNLNIELNTFSEEFCFAKEKTEKQKQAFENEFSLIKEVRELDHQISHKNNSLKDSLYEYKNSKKKHEGYIKMLQDISEQIDGLKKKTLETENYLVNNRIDEELNVELTGIKERIKNIDLNSKQLKEKENEILFEKENYVEAKKFYNEKIALYANSERDNKRIKTEIEQTKEKIKNLLNSKFRREYMTKYENLVQQRGFLQKINSLEDERKKLIDSNPCPLCGSLKHPYAEGNVPKNSDIDEKIGKVKHVIDKLEILDNKMRKQEETKESLDTLLNEALINMDGSLLEKYAIEHRIENLELDLVKHKEQLEKDTSMLMNKLEPFKIHETEILNKTLFELKKRSEMWRSNAKEKADFDIDKQDLLSKQTQTKTIIKDYEDIVKEKEALNHKNQEELDKISSKRKELYGLKNTDEEEMKFKNFLEDAQKYERIKKSMFDKTKTSITVLEERIKLLDEKIQSRSKKLTELELNFTSSLRKANFENESLFLLASMSSEDKKILIQKTKEFEHKLNSIEARKKDRTDRYKNQIEKKLTEKTLISLREELEKNQESLKDLRVQKGGVKEKIESNNQEKKNNEINQIEILNAQKESEKWSSLHALIGSSDGKKFRNFAQGITFELLITHANKQLENMTDRYLLIRDSEQPLELDVVDNYQAGEIRSTKNLSGGESFIVSLSLALGLSKMSSKKVKVDSLFLDEGFGTLDDEALETALETLAGLQQDGKLIGVISHVPALKEHIPTQISVQPISGGKSILKGPGISKKNTKAV